MTKKKKGFKKGAASFYIVAFSTLILVIIAASFATLILNEITRTSNDDLSQSAYDSAMAGVEDAKIAFMNYKRCKESGVTATKPTEDSVTPTCGEIIWFVEKAPEDEKCYSVARILGRIGKKDKLEVPISETTSSGVNKDNGLQQAYTCVTLDASLSDYRSNITSTSYERAIKVQFGDGVHAKHIDAVKISWYSNRDGVDYFYSNFDYNIDSTNTGKVVFKPVDGKGVSTPPTIAVQMIQTANEFTMEQFERTVDNTTNRGTVYLVPVGNVQCKSGEKNCVNNMIKIKPLLDAVESSHRVPDTYLYSSSNIIPATAMLESNDKTTTNKPYLVYCEGSTTTEYACSATIQLPKPVGGTRNDDTFMFTVSMPYEQPETDFSMEFICRKSDADKCSNSTYTGNSTTGEQRTSANLSEVQVKIDSTGRANDLFRRVETRLESSDGSFAYAFSAVQLLGGNKGTAQIQKNLKGVTSEWCDAGSNREQCKGL